MAKPGSSTKKFRGYGKVEGIKKLQKYNLPIPATLFVFNFKKQEKEIDDFLIGKRIVTIRSDKAGKPDFCPVAIRCLKKEAKAFTKFLTGKNYVAILQRYVPVRRDRVSGNILVLKNYIFIELMGTGALTQMNRDGRVEEQIKFKKSGFEEIGHFGKRLLPRRELRGILKLIKNVPPYKLLEFTLRPEGIYFWQIRDEETARQLEK